ncbi:MAG: MBL fold metallo-hydrolase [Blautia sp.]|nr:MBL fold metallo-hydrolase [Blautia sp.]
MKRFIHAVYTLLLMLALLGTISTVRAAEPFEVHVLDVGQGQAVLIEADEHFMLIDGGGRSASSFVISYLKQHGVDELDYAVVSHYDEDHMSGIIGVLNVFPVNILLLPGYAGDGDLYQSLAVAALSNGCAILHPDTGMLLSLGTGQIDVVGPVRSDYPTDNNRSLGFRIGYGDTHVLVCGDAEQDSEIDMADSGQDLSADVYVADHHGSSTSSMDAFLESVNPAYAIISCGQDNGYGHPSMETLQRLQNRAISMFRTDDQGTIVACSDGTDIWFELPPSDNWAAGSGSVALEMEPVESETLITRQVNTEDADGQQNDAEFRYVCNTNTKKFHEPDCSSVEKIKEKNRLNTNLTRDELIAEGYEPCGNCKP